MDPSSLRVTKNAYFLLLTHNRRLLLVTFCVSTAGIRASFRTYRKGNAGTDGCIDGQTEMEVEIVI